MKFTTRTKMCVTLLRMLAVGLRLAKVASLGTYTNSPRVLDVKTGYFCSYYMTQNKSRELVY